MGLFHRPLFLVLIIIMEFHNAQYTFRLSFCFEMYSTNVYKLWRNVSSYPLDGDMW